MNDVFSLLNVLGDDYMLDTILHLSFRRHIHRVRLNGIYKVLIHFGDINDFILRKVFELFIVNVCPVESKDVTIPVIDRLEHKIVVGGC